MKAFTDEELASTTMTLLGNIEAREHDRGWDRPASLFAIDLAARDDGPALVARDVSELLRAGEVLTDDPVLALVLLVHYVRTRTDSPIDTAALRGLALVTETWSIDAADDDPRFPFHADNPKRHEGRLLSYADIDGGSMTLHRRRGEEPQFFPGPVDGRVPHTLRALMEELI